MNNVLRHSYVVYWNVSTVLHPRGTPSIRAFFFLLIFLFCFYTTVTCAYNVNLVCCRFVGDLQKEMSSKFTLSIETLFAITISFIIHYLIWGIAEKAMLQQEHNAVVGGQQAATCITGHINNRLLYIFVVDITLLVLSAKRARYHPQTDTKIDDVNMLRRNMMLFWHERHTPNTLLIHHRITFRLEKNISMIRDVLDTLGTKSAPFATRNEICELLYYSAFEEQRRNGLLQMLLLVLAHRCTRASSMNRINRIFYWPEIVDIC